MATETKTVNLGIDLPRGSVMTPRGFAKLLTLAMTNADRGLLENLATALEDICPDLEREGLPNACRFADEFADQLYTMANAEWENHPLL